MKKRLFKEIIALSDEMGDISRGEAILNNFVLWMKNLSAGNIKIIIEMLNDEICVIKSKGGDFGQNQKELEKYIEIEENMSLLFKKKKGVNQYDCFRKLAEIYGALDSEIKYMWNEYFNNFNWKSI